MFSYSIKVYNPQFIHWFEILAFAVYSGFFFFLQISLFMSDILEAGLKHYRELHILVLKRV